MSFITKPSDLVGKIAKISLSVVAPLGIGGWWNDLFWVVQPSGPAILVAV